MFISASVRPVAYSIACDAPWLFGCVIFLDHLFKSLASPSGMMTPGWCADARTARLLRVAARAQAGAHKSEASRLQDRVDELEVAVPAAKNAELVAQLRKTQAELIHQLTELKVEGALEVGALEAMPGGAPSGEVAEVQ